MRKTTCSKCNQEKELNRHEQRYCLSCHAEYKRENGTKYKDLSSLQKKKNVARAYANVYKQRGKLSQEDCKCGSPSSEMHHKDYDKPLEVTWLCRECHLELHQEVA